MSLEARRLLVERRLVERHLANARPVDLAYGPVISSTGIWPIECLDSCFLCFVGQMSVGKMFFDQKIWSQSGEISERGCRRETRAAFLIFILEHTHTHTHTHAPTHARTHTCLGRRVCVCKREREREREGGRERTR